MAVREVLERMKADWSEPRTATHWGEVIPFQLSCRFSLPAATIALPFDVPEDLLEFWRFSMAACLFEDRKYGQWGLRILSPERALEATREYQVDRQRDCQDGDLVVGQFIGDFEVLLLRCDASCSDFGRVVVAAEIDRRGDWDTAAASLSEFLELYEHSQGAKYWQRPR